MNRVVPVSPQLSFVFRKSATVSPTVVQSTLITQKKTVTSGTLLSIDRPVAAVARERVAVVMPATLPTPS
jgi:hypothetical protein